MYAAPSLKSPDLLQRHKDTLISSHTHTHARTHSRTHARTRARTHTHTHTHAHTRTHTHARTHARTHTHTHTQARTHARTHIRTHTRTHTHTHTHTHKHTHSRKVFQTLQSCHFDWSLSHPALFTNLEKVRGQSEIISKCKRHCRQSTAHRDSKDRAKRKDSHLHDCFDHYTTPPPPPPPPSSWNRSSVSTLSTIEIVSSRAWSLEFSCVCHALQQILVSLPFRQPFDWRSTCPQWNNQ